MIRANIEILKKKVRSAISDLSSVDLFLRRYKTCEDMIASISSAKQEDLLNVQLKDKLAEASALMKEIETIQNSAVEITDKEVK